MAEAGVQLGKWQGERQGAAICGSPECQCKGLRLRPDAQGVRMRAIVGHTGETSVSTSGGSGEGKGASGQFRGSSGVEEGRLSRSACQPGMARRSAFNRNSRLISRQSISEALSSLPPSKQNSILCCLSCNLMVECSLFP